MEIHMLPALAAGLSATVFSLGGVPVSVTGSYSVLPAAPDPAHMEVVWPTSQMAMYTSVLMADGSRWQVPRVPRRLADGSVQITLKPANSQVVTTFVVAKSYLDVPIWWVGDVATPEPEPQGEDPSTEGGTLPDIIPPNGPITPTPEPTEPPAEG